MSSKRYGPWALIGAGLLCVSAAWVGAQEPADEEPAAWVCPPCGCASDDDVHASAGNCASCGMELVDAKSIPVVAILLFEGVDLFSAAAPARVFENHARVLTVADTLDPIDTRSMGEIVPETTFEALPRCDVLVLPSGYGALQAGDDELVSAWVARAVGGARHVIPVELGGVILAKCGAVEPLVLALSPRHAEHVGAEHLAGATTDTVNPIHDGGKVVAVRGGTHATLAACRVLERVCGQEAARRVATELGIPLEEAGAGK